MYFFIAAALESQCHLVKGTNTNAGHAMYFLLLPPWKSKGNWVRGKGA